MFLFCRVNVLIFDGGGYNKGEHARFIQSVKVALSIRVRNLWRLRLPLERQVSMTFY